MDKEQVLKKIKAYQERVHQTDIMVRRYLADRTSNPHPLHEELIEEIRKYEKEVHRFLVANRSTEIELHMDNLLYSVLVHEKAWKRLFEQAAHRDPDVLRRPQKREETPSEPGLDRLIDRLYDISKKKWAEYGVAGKESIEDLARRVVSEYRKAKASKKSLKAVYDKKNHRVVLKVKED